MRQPLLRILKKTSKLHLWYRGKWLFDNFPIVTDTWAQRPVGAREMAGKQASSGGFWWTGAGYRQRDAYA